LQLGTFGAILKYAIEIEGKAAEFYAKLSSKASGDAKAVFSDLSNASSKNVQALERTRRMEMQEMILEAISGIDTENYEVPCGEAEDVKGAIACAIEMETKAAKFYSDSASKLSFLANVKRSLEKVGRERLERVERLKKIA